MIMFPLSSMPVFMFCARTQKPEMDSFFCEICKWLILFMRDLLSWIFKAISSFQQLLSSQHHNTGRLIQSLREVGNPVQYRIILVLTQMIICTSLSNINTVASYRALTENSCFALALAFYIGDVGRNPGLLPNMLLVFELPARWC